MIGWRDDVLKDVTGLAGNNRGWDGGAGEVPAALGDAPPIGKDEERNEDVNRPKQDGGGVWHEVGRTDWMRGNNHPVFEKKIEMPFFPSAVQV